MTVVTAHEESKKKENWYKREREREREKRIVKEIKTMINSDKIFLQIIFS